MKSQRKIMVALFALVAMCSLSSCDKGSGAKRGATVIRSAEGKQKVNLPGTWYYKRGEITFSIAFEKDGSFEYICRERSITGHPIIKWRLLGTFQTNGNVLIMTYETVNNRRENSGVKVGMTSNFVVSIVNDNEIILAGSSGQRTYKRLPADKSLADII